MRKSLGDMTNSEWFWYSVRNWYLPMTFNFASLIGIGFVLYKVLTT